VLVTNELVSYKAVGGLIPYDHLSEFIYALSEKALTESQGRYSDNLELPPMSPKLIHLSTTLNQVFICLASCPEGLKKILID
jgi:hypothetical protein